MKKRNHQDTKHTKKKKNRFVLFVSSWFNQDARVGNPCYFSPRANSIYFISTSFPQISFTGPIKPEGESGSVAL
jgi:hypothetical protein